MIDTAILRFCNYVAGYIYSAYSEHASKTIETNGNAHNMKLSLIMLHEKPSFQKKQQKIYLQGVPIMPLITSPPVRVRSIPYFRAYTPLVIHFFACQKEVLRVIQG